MTIFHMQDYLFGRQDDRPAFAEWLSEHVGPLVQAGGAMRPLRTSFKSKYYRRYKPRIDFHKLRNEFTKETNLHFSVNSIHCYQGRGWRIYGVNHVISVRNPKSTFPFPYSRSDLVIKIFNDDLALQFKLAVL
jgi:hypothetical protein